MDLALNNIERLIGHKIQTTNQQPVKQLYLARLVQSPKNWYRNWKTWTRTRGDHPNNSITEIVQNTKSWIFEETCHSDSSGKPSTNTVMKTLK